MEEQRYLEISLVQRTHE